MKYFIREHKFSNGLTYIEMTTNKDKNIRKSEFNEEYQSIYDKCGKPIVAVIDEIDTSSYSDARKVKQNYIDRMCGTSLNLAKAFVNEQPVSVSHNPGINQSRVKDIPDYDDDLVRIYKCFEDGTKELVCVKRTFRDAWNWYRNESYYYEQEMGW